MSGERTYNELTWRERRASDIALWKLARKAKRDRKLNREARKAARRIAFAFGFRTVVFWHSPGNDFVRRLSGNFRYGNYCGVGHGVVAGETKTPINYLDCGCREHDFGRDACECLDAGHS